MLGVALGFSGAPVLVLVLDGCELGELDVPTLDELGELDEVPALVPALF